MDESTKTPAKGFYYHYKHDPEEPFNNYTYEVVGVAMHSETKERTVLYRPLYEPTYLVDADYSARPLEMFMENVTKDGQTMSRFTQITDPELITQLEAIKKEMYG